MCSCTIPRQSPAYREAPSRGLYTDSDCAHCACITCVHIMPNLQLPALPTRASLATQYVCALCGLSTVFSVRTKQRGLLARLIKSALHRVLRVRHFWLIIHVSSFTATPLCSDARCISKQMGRFAANMFLAPPCKCT